MRGWRGGIEGELGEAWRAVAGEQRCHRLFSRKFLQSDPRRKNSFFQISMEKKVETSGSSHGIYRAFHCFLTALENLHEIVLRL